MPNKDPEKQREAERKYRHSEKGKEVRRKYRHSEKGKGKFREYRQSERGKVKQREFDLGRGKVATKMRRKLNYEIKASRFPKPTQCNFKDATCYGALEYAHLDYERWDNVIPLCKSHHSRFDQENPKTRVA